MFIFLKPILRNIYFVQDPPHLIKTLRNNFLASRELWNGKPLSWDPIRQLIQHDMELLPRRLPKLGMSHVNPLSTEKMKVRLAAQVSLF